MSAHNILMAASGANPDKLYVDDVFSTYLYTGNGSTQTINNGIDLAGKGGLVWLKARSSPGTGQHVLYDTARGSTSALFSSLTNGAVTSGGTYTTTFNSNGFQTGTSGGNVNGSSEPNVGWTFRKAPKFFDCGTYTGNGVAGRQIPHSLGVAPGMVIVKRTNGAGNWLVWHRSIAQSDYLLLNATSAVGGGGLFGTNAPTATVFSFDTGFITEFDPNISGATYVWYAFAHDTGTDGLIQCGSFTTDGSGNATVTLGWEPQFVLCKKTNAAQSWRTEDISRGMSHSGTNVLFPDLSAAEQVQATTPEYKPNATGFDVVNNPHGASATVIYLAIRRPNKPPTTGTQVYNAIAYTGSNGNEINAGISFDLLIGKQRDAGYLGDTFMVDRLRGIRSHLKGQETAAEFTNSHLIETLKQFSYVAGSTGDSNYGLSSNGTTYINHFFKRAPGVFDVVCYTGAGSATTVAHNLGVAPEFVIWKARNQTSYGWKATHIGLTNPDTHYLTVNSTNGQTDSGGNFIYSRTASSLTFVADLSGATYNNVCYLWATKAGISKVGTYTGNGGSQTINCGFTTGARFIMCKRTDSTGDWYVWDSTRGIVAGNDPHLSLNSTAAEVTTNDSIDPDNTGFIVNQLAATNINVTSATYIYLAFA